MIQNNTNPFSDYGFKIGEGVDFESIREQKEAMGYNDETYVEVGKGISGQDNASVVLDSIENTPGTWYVYKDGVYSFMSHDDFIHLKPEDVVVDDVEDGKYTPVGIVGVGKYQLPKIDGKYYTRIISLFENTDGIAWSSTNSTVNNPVNYAFSICFDGQSETQTLVDTNVPKQDDFDAAIWVHNSNAFEGDTTVWYLPAAGEAQMMLTNLQTIKENITAANDKDGLNLGLVELPEDPWFWCSTEGGKGAWYWNFNTNNACVGATSKNNGYLVRGFACV